MSVWLMIVVALAGGVCGVKLKVPAGALIGSMLSVACLNVVTGSHTAFPFYVRVLTQIATGAFVGAKISKSDIRALRAIMVPVLIQTTCMLGFGIAAGCLLAGYTKLDFVTALFSAAPAGVADMTLASMAFHADSAKVALLQVVRLISVLSVMPSLVKLLDGRSRHPAPQKKAAPNIDKAYHGSLYDIVKTLAMGLACGIVGYASGFPAGAISFSMIGCAAYNITKGHAYMPMRLRRFIQCFAGAYIGGMITRGQVIEIIKMYDAVILVIIGFYILNFVVAFLLVRICKIDMVTSLLSSAAGGLTDMALVADELGADSAKVAAMQLTRVVGVIALYPLLIGMLTEKL